MGKIPVVKFQMKGTNMAHISCESGGVSNCGCAVCGARIHARVIEAQTRALERIAAALESMANPNYGVMVHKCISKRCCNWPPGTGEP